MAIFHILVFPGLLFLMLYGTFFSWLDRKLYARMQHRVGPPWFQPIADMIKLFAKEDIYPAAIDKPMYVLSPLIATAAVLTSMLYIPVWGDKAVFAFEGDLIVVLYLLTLPTLAFFLGGWSSGSPFPAVGSVRVITQLFAYEVPLIVAMMGPAIISGSWSISGISAFYSTHPLLLAVNALGCIVGIITLQGKLERIPFDIPEAETELASGTFAEYSGKLFGFFRITMDIELVVGAALIAAIFMGGAFGLPWWGGILLFFAKTLVVLFILAVIKTALGRVRIEQMVDFCWKYLVPAGIVQLFVSILVKGVIR
ncbi:MAG: NADH-quinone oxidoreductase subunit H [Spirochaetes bacterium]|nr:NADH-quinone oxidoreductase subunit H [Spirochaetota bacterium]